MKYSMKIYIATSKCTMKQLNVLYTATMKYWYIQWNIESLLKTMKIKSTIIQWCIEICNKTMKYTSIVQCNNTAQNFLCRI